MDGSRAVRHGAVPGVGHCITGRLEVSLFLLFVAPVSVDFLRGSVYGDIPDVSSS